MVNIQYFVDKVKAERDAAVGSSAGENFICASNGDVGTRPRTSHSISKFASVVNAGCGITFDLVGPKIRITCFGRRQRLLGHEGNSAAACERSAS